MAFAWNTFVTAAEDGDAATTGLQRAGELFDDGRFARSADSQIADADDQTTESALAENTFPIKIEAQLHDALEEQREQIKNASQNAGTKSVTTFEDNVNGELL